MGISPEIITIASLIVSAVLVGIVVFQYRSGIQQYETVNRPWLVLSKKGIIYDNHVCWHLENIGKLPAKDIFITSKPEFFTTLEKSIIPDIKNEPIKIGIIMPKQKHDFAFNYLETDTAQGHVSIQIIVTIKYKFLNKKKISKFRYYVFKPIEHEEITCIEAD
ncbi:MAG: hypothetical protein IIA83_00790 [Thaumarchaeota archaeon]|nr:hypothetical protein [Nitrososphaerota archaeon]